MQGINGWLAGFEKVHADGVKVKLPDVQGTRAIRDFLVQVQQIALGFADYWQNRLLDGGLKLDFYEIVQKFREYRSENASVEEFRRRHRDFAATHQGRTAAENRLCLCGQDHRFRECPYLNPKVREKGWELDIDTERIVAQKLQDSSEGVQALIASFRSKEPAPTVF